MTINEVEGLTKPTVSMHLRVWTDVFESLESEAKARRVSLNALLNQVLATHTRDDWVFQEVDFVRMPKDAYRLLLSKIPDDKLDDLGRSTARGVQNTMMVARSGAISLDAALDDLRFISKCGWFSIHETRKNGKRTICLVHDFGPRYSVVLSADVTDLFATFGVRAKITSTDSSVMIEY